MIQPQHRTSILLALLSGSLAAVLLLLALATHGSQGMFQLNRPVAEYTELLLARATELRIDLAIDFLYLCAYATFFVLLAPTLRSLNRDTATEPVFLKSSNIWVGALLMTALLDATENAHILSMLNAAEKGIPLSSDGIAWQAAESQVKFVSSYFGLFLLSFCLPCESLIEKSFVLVLRWIQAPIGVAIFVLPADFLKPFFLVRALFFVFGFWAMAWIIYQRAKTKTNFAASPLPLARHA